jgi:hypothetical protein
MASCFPAHDTVLHLTLYSSNIPITIPILLSDICKQIARHFHIHYDPLTSSSLKSESPHALNPNAQVFTPPTSISAGRFSVRTITDILPQEKHNVERETYKWTTVKSSRNKTKSDIPIEKIIEKPTLVNSNPFDILSKEEKICTHREVKEQEKEEEKQEEKQDSEEKQEEKTDNSLLQYEKKEEKQIETKAPIPSTTSSTLPTSTTSTVTSTSSTCTHEKPETAAKTAKVSRKSTEQKSATRAEKPPTEKSAMKEYQAGLQWRPNYEIAVRYREESRRRQEEQDLQLWEEQAVLRKYYGYTGTPASERDERQMKWMEKQDRRESRYKSASQLKSELENDCLDPGNFISGSDEGDGYSNWRNWRK